MILPRTVVFGPVMKSIVLPAPRHAFMKKVLVTAALLRVMWP
jgi:hypothetical protein